MTEQNNLNLWKESWERFLWQKEYVKNYRIPFQLDNHVHNPPTLITDQILPGIMYIRLTSILDDSLAYYINTNNLQMPSKFRNDLKGRINYLDSLGTLKNSKELHKIREKRNKLSHTDSTRVDWNEVEPAIDIIHNELQNMKLVDEKPKYEFFGEHSELKKSKDPDVLGTVNYAIGVKENGKIKTVQSWTVRILDE